MMKTKIFALSVTAILTLTGAHGATTNPAIVVNADNFDRAQTDFEFAGII